MTNTTQSKSESTRTASGLTTFGRLAGAVGAVLIVSTPFTVILTGAFGALAWGKLLIGAMLVAIYVATNGETFARLAGARSTGLLAMTAVSVVLVIGVVGVLNFVAYKNPKQLDLTREGLYTLSEQTTKLLGRLKDDVKVYAFYASHEQSYDSVKEVLTRYREAGSRFSFEMVSPQDRPDLVERYSITDRGPRIVVTARGQDARAKDISEEELTNGIVKVAEQTSKTIYFLTGHGEPNLSDGENAEGYKGIAEAIRAEGYAVEPLSLIKGEGAAKGDKLIIDPAAASKGAPKADAAKGAKDKATEVKQDAAGIEVPKNVSVLIVAGPRAPLLPPEVAALEAYAKKGGRLIVLLDPDNDGGLSSFLLQWRVQLHKDLVVDTNPLNRLMGLGAAAPMVQPTEAQAEHMVVRDLTSPAVFMAARSLGIAPGGEPGVEPLALLESGQSAWGETNLQDGTAGFDDKDNPGPLTMAVVATKTVIDADKLSEEARVFVAGDSEWVNNKYLAVQGNRDLFVNLVNWLAEEQQKIAIRPKARAASQLFLSGEQMGQIKFLSLDILPVLIIAVGLGIVLVRRQR